MRVLLYTTYTHTGSYYAVRSIVGIFSFNLISSRCLCELHGGGGGALVRINGMCDCQGERGFGLQVFNRGCCVMRVRV